jgi:hypothetical protein
VTIFGFSLQKIGMTARFREASLAISMAVLSFSNLCRSTLCKDGVSDKL